MTWLSFGEGDPLVLIPGIQGRWEWMAPTAKALARHHRVITFSLRGERSSRLPLVTSDGFDPHVDQVRAVLDEAGIAEASICGVSYGGLVALRFAALEPRRVRRLVLASTPGPDWRPDERITRYVASPRTSAFAFVTGAPGRLAREIAAAVPEPLQRLRTVGSYLASIVGNPPSPIRMAARVRCLAGHDFRADCARVVAPTLVVTGEADLDRVVPVAGTLAYVEAIGNARAVKLERTGHIGCVTRADAFADIVGGFLI